MPRLSSTLGAADAPVGIGQPPAGTWMLHQGDRIVAGTRLGGQFGGPVILLFTIGFCGLAFYIVQREGLNPAFWMVAALIAYLAPRGLLLTFGKLEAVVKGDEGLLFKGIGPIGVRRRFRWRDIRSVEGERREVGVGRHSSITCEITLAGRQVMTMRTYLLTDADRFGFFLLGLQRLFLDSTPSSSSRPHKE